MEAVVDASVPNVALAEYKAPDNYPGRQLPVVPGRHACDGVLAMVAELREPFERLYRTFDHPRSASDPVHIVRRYGAADDREVVGFCAAGLAFGRVASVLHSIESLLAVMGPRPAAFVRKFDPASDGKRLAPLVHRWIRGSDLAALMLILQRMLSRVGID